MSSSNVAVSNARATEAWQKLSETTQQSLQAISRKDKPTANQAFRFLVLHPELEGKKIRRFLSLLKQGATFEGARDDIMGWVNGQEITTSTADQTLQLLLDGATLMLSGWNQLVKDQAKAPLTPRQTYLFNLTAQEVLTALCRQEIPDQQLKDWLETNPRLQSLIVVK